MLVKLLKSKIHRATVTRADLNYEGSISIDTALMKRAGLLPHEAVNIWNVNNGERFETYVIPAKENSGEIGVNGSAARRVQTGDLLILAAFCHVEEPDAEKHHPTVVFVDSANQPVERPQATVR
jgi:aspartate 1-decarboxylase